MINSLQIIIEKHFIVFVIYLFFSIILTFSKAVRLLRVKKQLKLFTKHLEKIKNKDDHSIRSYEILLNQSPKIQKIGLYQYHLGYSDPPEANIRTIEQLPNKLRDVKNYAKHTLITSLYPTSVFKFIFSLPSKFIQSLGLAPAKHKAIYNNLVLIFNLIIWCVVYLLNLFSPEIKELILSNLKAYQ